MQNNEPLFLSLIIPVYNRPQEVDELLESLCKQSNRNFEVVLVEDGSKIPCTAEVEKYKAQLRISYYAKPNSGPGTSRNYGAERASGNYVVFLDSDCVIPPHYVQTVYDFLNSTYTDAFGGPDRASDSFTLLQKAINYAMTSFFTTGGIRGGGEKLDKFYPRSFNMGYSRAVLHDTKGFSAMRFGEDIDMSIRILKLGYKTALIKDAWVYHKRRTSLRQFYKQVYNSGIARINLHKRHPGSMKVVHTFPSLFVLGVFAMALGTLWLGAAALLPLGLWALLIATDSTIKNKNLLVGLVSIVASCIQLSGYGLGFIVAFFKRIVFAKKEFASFVDNFYE